MRFPREEKFFRENSKDEVKFEMDSELRVDFLAGNEVSGEE